MNTNKLHDTIDAAIRNGVANAEREFASKIALEVVASKEREKHTTHTGGMMYERGVQAGLQHALLLLQQVNI